MDMALADPGRANSALKAFGRVRQLLELLRGVDLTKWAPIYEAIQALRAADGVANQVRAAIEVARTLAQATDTEVDDQIVNTIDRLFKGSLFDVLVGVIERMLDGGEDTIRVSANQEVLSACASAGIPYFVLLQLAEYLVSLILDLRKQT